MLKNEDVETATTALRAKNRSGANNNLANKLGKPKVVIHNNARNCVNYKGAIKPFGAALCLILRSHFWLCKASISKSICSINFQPEIWLPKIGLKIRLEIFTISQLLCSNSCAIHNLIHGFQ